MTTPQNEITIQDIGPIRKMTVPVAPGVTVLRGKNELGKSTVINCAEALVGQPRDLEARDGQPVGTVSGAGMSLVISRNARNSRAGELEVEAVEDRIDLGVLVDPPLKDKAARTRARVKALLSLTGTKVSLEDFRQVVPPTFAEELILETDITTDPIESAGKVKRRLEAGARESSEKAESLKAELNQLLGAIETLEIGLGELTETLAETPSATIAESLREERMADLLALKQKKRAIEKQLETQSEAAAQFEESKELIAETQNRLNDLRGDRDDAAADVRDGEKAVEELEEELSEARSDLVRRRQALAERDAVLGAVTEQAQAFDNLAKMSEATIDEPPTAEEIAAAEVRADNAIQLVQAVKDQNKVAHLKATHQATLEEQGGHLKRAEIIRAGARAVDAILANAIDSPYFEIQNGELCFSGFGEVERDPEAFERLSDGKRWTVAIQAVAYGLNAKERLAMVGIAQDAWESLDTENRQRVVAAAINANLAIITAAHDDEEQIHVDHIPLTSTDVRG